MERLIVHKPSVRKPGVSKPSARGSSEPLFPRLREALAPAVAPVVSEVVGAVANAVARAGEKEKPKAEGAPDVGRMILENAPALISAALDGEITEKEAHSFVDRAAQVAHEIITDAYARKKP